MKQRQLEREVADVTGESLGTIRRRGFSVIDLLSDHFDPEPNDLPPQVYDWDQRSPMPVYRAA